MSDRDSAGAPLLHQVIDLTTHLLSRLGPADARHEQLVVARIDVPHGCLDGKHDGMLIERSPRCGTPDPAAAASPGVMRDSLRPIGRAARKCTDDLGGQLRLELPILANTPLLLTPPASRASL